MSEEPIRRLGPFFMFGDRGGDEHRKKGTVSTRYLGIGLRRDLNGAL
jgi:hypothetical protein